MQLTPYFVIWAVFAMIVLALALVRYLVSFREDDNIHISEGESGMITKQMALFGYLRTIDRWGKTLTVIAFAGGVVLALIYGYQKLP